MKRYVKEMISDFKKDYAKKCKENPDLLPAGFLYEIRKLESMCEHGIVTDREAVKNITAVWDGLDDWILENKGKSAIKL